MGSAVAGARAGRAEGVQRLGPQPWSVERGGGDIVLFGGEGAESLGAPAAPGAFLHAPRCQSCALEGSTLTPAPRELCCRWALGCLGHTVVGLGQGHIARRAVAAVGALRVLAGAAPAQGLRGTHLLALVDVCKEEKDGCELVAQRAISDRRHHLLVPLPVPLPVPQPPLPSCPMHPLAPPGCPPRPHQPPTLLGTSAEPPLCPTVTPPAFGIIQQRR